MAKNLEDGVELKKKFNELENEIEKLLVKFLATISLNHPLHRSKSGYKIAASEVLSHDRAAVKSAVGSYDVKNLFQTEKCDKLLSSINIAKLDNGLILHLLLRVDHILGIGITTGNCTDPLHVVCSVSCNHSSTVCEKCKSNNGQPTRKCNHKCNHCQKKQDECIEGSKLCCSRCTTCMTCNKRKMDANVSKMLVSGAPTPTPCCFSMFIFCLGVLLSFRNLVAHTTVEVYSQFLIGKEHLKGFERITDEKQLLKYIEEVSLISLDYVNDNCNKDNSLTNAEYTKFQQNIKDVIEPIDDKRIDDKEEDGKVGGIGQKSVSCVFVLLILCGMICSSYPRHMDAITPSDNSTITPQEWPLPVPLSSHEMKMAEEELKKFKANSQKESFRKIVKKEIKAAPVGESQLNETEKLKTEFDRMYIDLNLQEYGVMEFHEEIHITDFPRTIAKCRIHESRKKLLALVEGMDGSRDDFVIFTISDDKVLEVYIQKVIVVRIGPDFFNIMCSHSQVNFVVGKEIQSSSINEPNGVYSVNDDNTVSWTWKVVDMAKRYILLRHNKALYDNI